jgi:hypothetical protein
MYYLRTLFVIVLVLLLAGCAKYTGGGWIESDLDGNKANFGFIADGCYDDFELATGQFNFHDKYADPPVKMKGEVLKVMKWGGMHCVFLHYESKDRANPGDGFAKACVIDGGEGFNAEDPDWVKIKIMGGPFGGYENSGVVQGNIQKHECAEPDFD